MRRSKLRSGRAFSYFVVGLLGGVLGGLLVMWMAGRPVGRALLQGEPPYREGTSPTSAAPVPPDGTVVRAVQVVGPGVVNINTVSTPPSQGAGLPEALRRLLPNDTEPQPQQGRGSGFIINAQQGYVVTNNHVVADARNITVFLPDKRSFPATVVGTDPYADVAVVKISGSKLPEEKLGNSDNLPIGSTAIAIGNPFGFENSVTVGVISAVNRELPAPSGLPLENLIQTDAAINPGNSGGPLCDINGNVIAMNTAIIPMGQGIGFAVAVNTIKRSVEDIIQYGRGRRPWLGIEFQPVTPEIARQLGVPVTQGVLVREVVARSPAAGAGVQAGDVMTAIAGAKIVDYQALRDAIRRAHVGDVIELDGYRGDRAMHFRVTLGEMPPPDQLIRRQ